ncbi:hypothetical protein [Pseudomonas sp. dw_358]|uniref:hypothetical protein n=1 Tax=Pseudomonas sp. dw_358 TaxID=2720083 RepID=UPI001BD68262|nr:hypothetical protein [Pseudomonas sp. dw_358]
MTEYKQSQPNAPTTDTSGKPVDVVERDIEERHAPDEAVDEVITPTSTRRKEQDAETLEREDAAIERSLKKR